MHEKFAKPFFENDYIFNLTSQWICLKRFTGEKEGSGGGRYFFFFYLSLEKKNFFATFPVFMNFNSVEINLPE